MRDLATPITIPNDWCNTHSAPLNSIEQEHRWYFTLGVGINVLIFRIIMRLQCCLHPIQHHNPISMRWMDLRIHSHSKCFRTLLFVFFSLYTLSKTIFEFQTRKHQTLEKLKMCAEQITSKNIHIHYTCFVLWTVRIKLISTRVDLKREIDHLLKQKFLRVFHPNAVSISG